MPITIYDIAEEAKISYATVSRALKNDPRISEKTREKVKGLAKTLGYRPNHAGQILKAGKTNTIGLILPSFSNPFYIEFLEIIEQQCKVRGYQVVPIDFGMDSNRERACFEQMLGRRCDGIISFVSHLDPLKDLVEEFWVSKIPCVIWGLPDDVGSLRIDGCTVDMSIGLEKAVKYLKDMGHRKILIGASWPEESDAGTYRIKGFSECFAKFGLSFSEKNVLYRYTGNLLEDGMKVARDYLESRRDATAMIGVNDLFITGFYRGITEKGLRVPEDISLVGTDNTWVGQYWQTALTSIDLKAHEGARIITDVLFERLETQDWGDPRYICLRSDLIIRESTGPARKV
jgi:LacI family transcriptional regulator